MPSITLSTNPTRSGYLRWQTGGTITSGIPSDNATAGMQRGEPNYEYRGFLAFDASEIPPSASITAATLTIPTATSEGEIDLWTIRVHTGGTIDLDDLPGTYDGGTFAWSTTGADAPESIEAVIPEEHLVDMLGDGEIAIRIDNTTGPFTVLALWHPEIAGATLDVEYEESALAARIVPLGSELATEAGMSSGLADETTAESALVTSTTKTAGIGASVTLDSGLRRSAGLVSRLPERG